MRQSKPARRVPKRATAVSAPKGRTAGKPFLIVGIGASAGGLEALELFLRNVPAASGMAFVIVQHLDPTRKGLLVDLLQRHTPMPIAQVHDRHKVEPDHVYVIPPNKDLSILNGTLHLLAPTAPRGLRLPIDFFLKSLAADSQHRAIAVILSGMGSDGALGLGAIKEDGGAVFVQEPTSAKFDGMPRSAIDTGLVDVIALAQELPKRIAAYQAHAPRAGSAEVVLTAKTHSVIEKICVLIRASTGYDFSKYKRTTISRRIERRMGLHQLTVISDYVRFLQENPQEIRLLFKELLIGVTSFFRDPAAWEYLRTVTLPALLTKKPEGEGIRVWVAGCSSGEEAYSLAILFKEALAEAHPSKPPSLQIFATDLDKDAVARARNGLYPRNIAADVSEKRLTAFFIEEPNGFRVRPEIRETVIFALQNLIMDPPFTKLDLVICRNVLIYLTSEVQKKLMPLFHYSLCPSGVLFLGSSETVGTDGELFSMLNPKWRLYSRVNTTVPATAVDFPSTFAPRVVPEQGRDVATAVAPNLQSMAERVLLDRYAPAAVMTNAAGDILYVSGHTGQYLEPAAGKANWNINAMARDELRFELISAFERAVTEKRLITLSGIRFRSNGTPLSVDVTIEPMSEHSALKGLTLIVFSDSPATVQLKTNVKPNTALLARLEQALRDARLEVHTIREDMQTSQEELRSANEELQSTNEELQSTNEELTTSKEEMQSLNEELQTVNHELQSKVDELSRTNDDMRNLLDSTDIATLFLDARLTVRRFTAQMTKIIKLRPSDISRPITDLASDLMYPHLADDAHTVLKTLAFKETAVTTVDGRWFSIRIMPYRTLDNRIDGVVITCVDISVAKRLEATLRLDSPRALS